MTHSINQVGVSKRSLRFKVSLASIFSIFVFGLSTGTYFLYKERNIRIEGLKSEIIKTSSFLVQQAYILLKQPQESSLLNATQIVHQNVSQGNFAFVEIVKPNGKVIVPYDPLDLNTIPTRSNAIKNGPWGSLALGQNILIQEAHYPDVGSVIEGLFGIVEKNRILGYCVLGVSKKPIQTAFRKSMIATMTLLLILLGISVALSWTLSRIATAPVLELAKRISSFKETEHWDQLQVTGTKEVEILSSSLQNYISKNRHYELSMQETIKEKTKSLEKTKSEMKAVLDLSNRLSRVLDLDGLARELIETAKQIVYCNEAFIFLKDKENQESIRQIPSTTGDKKELIVSLNLIQAVLRKGEMEMIPDTSSLIYKEKFDPLIRSSVLVPILSPNRESLGVLFLAMTGESQFDQDELLRLKGGMKTVGVFFENVLLFSEKERLSRHDSMTGLLNRQNIMEEVYKELLMAQRRNGSLYILLADIDHFKKINDTYGHLVGDKVIKEFSRILSSSRRVGEHTGRFGGEEFLVVLPNTDLDAALAVADKISSQVHKSLIQLGIPEPLTFTISIGIAGIPQDGSSVEELINKADKALYLAKAKGRNQVVVWNQKLDQRMPELFLS
ncbi:MAG: hypothetical protein A3I11_06925 [Elusimicrobia bacterium RIFCSPLOWO2_02_FULL_39_32]|nr:MAG: hypothetical protein A3B80_05700 [Elusimicrobia bacterium RIFCSPHIGHO2_02_FULL_39_36]OGR91920.1 MAG: hypothetical protein A3I11_06925 [Elusimicrobia bacterium RIFCSPLOWO2_02_FULL_39_32]OGR98786.1 MAG: hypothetical protein A3G85_05505 [Elusimicrobia bacterium RIFCSPLOWO2_12_FULL_39_28]